MAHWFNLPQFYAACQRVLRPGGILAVTGYGLPHITPTIDGIITERLLQALDPFWAPGNRLLMEGYRTLPFPFPEIAPWPKPAIVVRWDLPRLLAYLSTWSAVKRYRNEVGRDPLEGLGETLRSVWGPPSRQRAAGRTGGAKTSGVRTCHPLDR